MPPSPDPLRNPYASPASHLAEAGVRGASSRSSYESERRSVMLLLLLSVVTFGLYPAIWYLRRAPFLDSLSADKKVGGMPWINLVAYVLSLGVAVARAPEGLARLAQIAVGVINLVLAFRVARILRSDFARSGRFIGISGAGVFFFGSLYLQHVMNEAADTPARLAKENPADPASSEEDYDARIDRELKGLDG